MGSKCGDLFGRAFFLVIEDVKKISKAFGLDDIVKISIHCPDASRKMVHVPKYTNAVVDIAPIVARKGSG